MYQFLNLRSFDLTQHTLYGSAISLSQLNIYEFPIQAMALLAWVIRQSLCHVHYTQHRISRRRLLQLHRPRLISKDFLKHVRKLLDETCEGLSLVVVKAKEGADGDVELGSSDMKTEDGDGVNS